MSKKKKIDKHEVFAGEELLKLKSQIDELNEQLMRERADAMNVRRRADEERLKLGSYFKVHVIKELMPFIDNYNRAMQHAPAAEHEEWQKWYKGVESVGKQLEDALTKLGVERIKTVGEPFDPELHEAVSAEEGEGDQEIVSEELQSGYKIGDEVIRHAMVRVKG